MIVFPCQTCQTPLSANDDQTGKLVRCPSCSSTLRVPGGPASAPPVAGAPPTPPPYNMVPPPAMAGAGALTPAWGMGMQRPIGRRYGFSCGYCSSRLEANEAMGGQDGQCPTCGNNITIPILDRYGRLIDPRTRQIIKPDPHPVHAYAAAGERAPRILRQRDNSQVIQCARCNAISTVTSNNCRACGMPFTMEGTTVEAAGSSNGFCVASMVLGIIGMPAFCTVITPLLGIVFGLIGLIQVNRAGGSGGGKGMAIAGIVCGLIGGALCAWWHATRWY